jgi:dihydrofolate reductase
MKNLVLAIFLSLDGYIEGPGGEFVAPPWSAEVAERWADHNLANAGHLIYGRVNFEFNKGFWTSPAAAEMAQTEIMNRLPKTVVSRTLSGDPGWNGVVMKGGLPDAVRGLKKSVIDGDIYCFGGAGLARSLMLDDLVDDYYLMVTPNVLGNGKRLFEPGIPRVGLTLVEARPLDVGSVILHYRRAGAD